MNNCLKSACIILMLSTLSGFRANCQNDICLVRKKNYKELLLPIEHYQLYFRVIPSSNIFDQNKMPLIHAKEFPIDSGFIGTPYEYRGVSHDSITLELPDYWESSPAKYTMQYRIPLSDVSEIFVQRTYNKTTEQISIWGGALGVVSLISAPIYYFTDHKELAAGWLALGITSITASIVSYKIHFGYDKYKKPYFKVVEKY